MPHWCRGSIAGKETGLQTGWWRNLGLIPVGARDLSQLPECKDWLGGSSSLLVWDVWCATSPVVENLCMKFSTLLNVVLRLMSGFIPPLPHMPLWCVQGYLYITLLYFYCRLQLKCDGTRWCTGGELKGKLANGVGSQYSSHYIRTWCIQHYYCWCAHLSCQ